jgi:hypothetical protein
MALRLMLPATKFPSQSGVSAGRVELPPGELLYRHDLADPRQAGPCPGGSGPIWPLPARPPAMPLATARSTAVDGAASWRLLRISAPSRHTRRQLAFAARTRQLFDQGHTMAAALRILGLEDELAAERALTARLSARLGRAQSRPAGG